MTTKHPLWNYAPQALAICSLVAALFEFQKKPAEVAIFIVATAIGSHLTDGTNMLVNITSLIAGVNQFWYGSWTKRFVMALIDI